MAGDETVYIKSGGRRIPLYAELGKYFLPDGSLKETALRSFIRESLEKIKKENEEEESSNRIGEWLSSHLEEVQGYLEEKGMTAASLRFFEVALDESARMGVDKVMISSARLKSILSKTSLNGDSAPEKKSAPDLKRKKIFDSALRIFAERGFHEATIDEIASLSGVGKGTVYRNFKSKEDLLDQLLKEKSKSIVERFSRIFSQDQNVLEQIREFIELWVEFIEKNHRLYRVIQSEGINPRSGKRTMFYDYLISNLPMIKERIVSMNIEGELKTTSFYTAFYGTLGFIDGVVNKWFRSGMDYPLREEIPVILEILFNGFVGEPNSGKVFFIPPENEGKGSKA